jgi:uncharacterized membrane protein
VIPTPGDLESRYRWLSIAAVVLFSGSLTLGLVLYVARPGSAAALIALHTGLLLLMASPGIRMTIAAAERIRRRDWAFVLMTLVVLAELAVVMWRAAAKA